MWDVGDIRMELALHKQQQLLLQLKQQQQQQQGAVCSMQQG